MREEAVSADAIEGVDEDEDEDEDELKMMSLIYRPSTSSLLSSSPHQIRQTPKAADSSHSHGSSHV